MDRNMELQSNNINTFIQHCIQKAKTKETPDLRSEEESISSMENNDDYQNSSLLYYQNDNTDHEPIEPDLIDEGLEIYHRQRNIELPIEHRYDEESTVYHYTPNFEFLGEADENSTLKNIRFSQEDDQQYSLNTDISSLDSHEYRTNVDTYSEADYLTNASIESHNCNSYASEYLSGNSTISTLSQKDIELYSQDENEETDDSDATDIWEEDSAMNIGDNLPKTFLELSGISVANFNTGCNFQIDAAITLMIHYDLHILTIQEHTPWNKELTHIDISYIDKQCEKWGFFVTTSKTQIVIIDKRLSPCHKDTKTYLEGRICCSKFELSANKYVEFVTTYGYPHSPKNRNIPATDDETVLRGMRELSQQLQQIIRKAQKENIMIFVFGDLQDTPDGSKNFTYGPSRISKHPLGIIKTCEDMGMLCTIYQHLESLERPVISRHGPKGGRFIDGMYTFPSYLSCILGIIIVHDTGIYSDHNLIISKCDLKIEKYEISKQKEERIDFRQIMSIPMSIKHGTDHPSLREDKYKGEEFYHQAKLYQKIQKVVKDPKLGFHDRITDIKRKVENLEKNIIAITRDTISPQEQANGKLIPRTLKDAQDVNEASQQFFQLISEICRQVGLSRYVPIVNNAVNRIKKKDIASGKTIPGIASVPISKNLDDTLKRTRMILQRLQITYDLIRTYQRLQSSEGAKQKELDKIQTRLKKSMKRILNQQPKLLTSMRNSVTLCHNIMEDRANHVQAIEYSRQKVCYDNMNEFQDAVIDTQGQEEYQEFLQNIKSQIFEDEFIES